MTMTELQPRVYDPYDSPASEAAVTLGQMALVLRLRGKSYPFIARLLKVPMKMVEEAIAEELATIPDEAKDQLRRLELMRTDTLLNAVWDQASKGHIPAVRAATDLLKRRAAMTGIDAALKVETTDRLDAEIEKLLEELAERSQRERYAD